LKIAILTSGILPVPALLGGAVENLVDLYLEYNDQHRIHDITVYSVWHPGAKHHPAQNSDVNHYIYYKVESRWAKILKRILHYYHKDREYYHYTIEYYLEKAIHHIKHQNYDAIILENRPGYALRLKDYTNSRLIYHLHNEKLDSKSKLAGPIYDAAEKIITVSDFIATRVKTINPNDTKTIIVHNGIDLKTFTRNARESIPQMFSEEDFVLVFSGRVNREKGVMELIEAMTLLKNHPKIKLMIIGSSFFGNVSTENSFIKSLKAKAETIKEQIAFTGFIPHSQMPIYLNAADIAVIPSVWDDPFPTTVLEAQAMGLPIVTTRRGGIPEEVTEDNAILLETDEHFVDHLANAILDLYEHPEKCKQMSSESLKRSKFFDKETYAKNFFTAIETR